MFFFHWDFRNRCMHLDHVYQRFMGDMPFHQWAPCDESINFDHSRRCIIMDEAFDNFTYFFIDGDAEEPYFDAAWKPSLWRANTLTYSRLSPAQTGPLCADDLHRCPPLIAEAETMVEFYKAKRRWAIAGMKEEQKRQPFKKLYLTPPLLKTKNMWELRLEYMRERLAAATKHVAGQPVVGIRPPDACASSGYQVFYVCIPR